MKCPKCTLKKHVYVALERRKGSKFCHCCNIYCENRIKYTLSGKKIRRQKMINFAANNIFDMEIIRTASEFIERMKTVRNEGKTIGLVPTMGALHAGHRSLMEIARRDNDFVVVSVFVNPTQFNNPRDLETYPRTEESDLNLLREANVDLAFVPTVREIYPQPDKRVFNLGKVAEVMEGAMRPGHFNGVCQIVSKLFEMSGATNAYFGEKDFQQIAVIKRMKELLGMDINIVSCPIKREDDGLAMSSRNKLLTAEGRKSAPNIYKALKNSLDRFGTMTVEETIKSVIDEVNSDPELETEYYAIVDTNTMQPIKDWNDAEQAVGCITVHCGAVRLIDNIVYPKSK